MNTMRWWLVLVVWVAVSVWVHLFYIKRIRLTNEPVLAPIRITDGIAFEAQLPGSLFKRASSELESLDNRSAVVYAVLDSLAGYLKSDPRRRLTVTGFHTSDESRALLTANLGVLRAQAVELYLLNAGAPGDQIRSKGSVSETLPFVRDSVGGLTFSFEAVSIDAEWLARQQKYSGLFQPLQLYFATGSTEYIHTPDNERFAREAIAYLRNHPTERLVLTGHTDSVGTAAGNLQLSRLRATAVRDRFLQQGASERWFQIVAQGDKSPIATNATVEGREVNRRVTMEIRKQ